MNRRSESPLPLAARQLPPAAPHEAANIGTAAMGGADSNSAALRRLLARLLRDESALYAITRDWRYDVASRKFARLHSLLDEQFTEIGLRLVALAARARALDLQVSNDPSDRAAPASAGADDGRLEAHIMAELLHLHEALLGHLRAGKTMSENFHDSKTTDLLADLIANHEKDAFMLRALLWEVQNNAA